MDSAGRRGEGAPHTDGGRVAAVGRTPRGARVCG